MREYVVAITNTETGETRKYLDSMDESIDIDTLLYPWGDGNYSCDCNRSLFFARANNEDDPLITHCGMERYTVEIIVGGEVIYGDIEK